jgi:hypothetical protein
VGIRMRPFQRRDGGSCCHSVESEVWSVFDGVKGKGNE